MVLSVNIQGFTNVKGIEKINIVMVVYDVKRDLFNCTNTFGIIFFHI